MNMEGNTFHSIIPPVKSDEYGRKWFSQSH